MHGLQATAFGIALINSNKTISPCMHGTLQALVVNGLRDRVLLRADGGMRAGRDVLIAGALGADEYGFGTVAMIATGCIMARVCHTNNCPVGVASQREELRARFPGAPADLVRGQCSAQLWSSEHGLGHWCIANVSVWNHWGMEPWRR